MRKKKILVFGWYGAGNWGDELLLSQFVRWATESGGEVTALSVNPTHTMRTHGIPAVDFQDLPAVASAVSGADLFVLGGGGLFQTYDEFQIEALYRYKRYGVSIYAKPVLIARQFGVPVLLWAQGIGPLDSADSVEIVRDLFTGALASSVRDQASFDLLKSTGVIQLPLIGPDPIWAYSVDKHPGVRSSRPARRSGRRIAVVIREWSFDKDWQDKLYAALSANVAHDDTLVYLPFQPLTDTPISREFAKRFGSNVRQEFVDTDSVDKILETISGADRVIAMRLHAQIISLKLGKPTLCVEYDKKMSYASNDAGVPDELRLSLEDDPEIWRHSLSAFMESKFASSHVADLEGRALLHKSLLGDTISKVDFGRGRATWRSGEFDWVGSWSSDEMNAAVRDLRSELAERSSESLRKDIKIDALERRNGELKEEVKTHRSSLTSLVQEISRVLEGASGHEKRLEELSDRLSEAGQNADRLAAICNEQESLVSTRDKEIESLCEKLSESEKHLAVLSRELRHKQERISLLESSGGETRAAYDRVMRSNSMKFTSPFRSARRLLDRSRRLLFAFFQAAHDQGIQEADSRVRGKLTRFFPPGNIGQVAVLLPDTPNEARYLLERNAQDAYVGKYLDIGITDEDYSVWHAGFIAKSDKRKVVLYPLSYPLELTQRPDHIVRCFSEMGYQVIIISVDGDAPFVREISPSVYHTNLFGAAITHFSNRDVIFYITYPFYAYILNYLKRARVLYDVLDDLTVFSLHCDAMVADHQELLQRSEHVIFSSAELLNSNRQISGPKTSLVTNGVWPGDFELGHDDVGLSRDFRGSDREYVIGYHGAISELLDWSLIKQLVELPNVRLVMVGPVVNFDDESAEDASAKKAVFASSKLTHIEPVPYKELKHYLRGFDAGIIPFKVNQKTDPVSPLKLFEYMAMGLPIYATPTKTLLEYSEHINVLSPGEIVSAVAHVAMGGAEGAGRPNYKEVLDKVDWKSQLQPVISSLGSSLPSVEKRAERKRVDIVNVNFYDWDGVHVYKGGAERYVYDLACLFKDMGCEARILQNAHVPFERDFKGIPVLGVQADPGHDMRGMSKTYRRLCADADLVIASPADLACELWGLNVIGINHGIYWDHKFKTTKNHSMGEYRNIFDSLKASNSVVAVDTNFINWVRTYDYNLGHKVEYVPNYVDCTQFSAVDKSFANRVRVLYPRRLYEARGIFITLAAFERLFERHRDLELHLVGQANDDDRKIIDAFVERFQGRVVVEEFDMDEMHQVYRTSHVVLIPTLYSEGTSLSCIEAMASNNAIIATNVGGLPNLVVDEFNGLLISPSADALVESLERLLSDRELMKEMAANGVKMARAFDKAKWIEKWKRVIESDALPWLNEPLTNVVS